MRVRMREKARSKPMRIGRSGWRCRFAHGMAGAFDLQPHGAAARTDRRLKLSLGISLCAAAASASLDVSAERPPGNRGEAMLRVTTFMTLVSIAATLLAQATSNSNSQP